MSQKDKEALVLKLHERDGVDVELLAERFRVKRPAITRWLRNARAVMSSSERNPVEAKG